jgi:hypothetical protein
MAALSAVLKNSSAVQLIFFCTINFTVYRTVIAILNCNSYMNVLVFQNPRLQKSDNILLLFAFFWVIPKRLNFICRRFGTLCLFHLHRRMGMKNDSV